MRYEIIEVGQECGEVEYQVSDVHPNGDRTHSYDFLTLAEAEECLDELNKINNNNGETKMNIFTKIALIIAILAGSMFITTTAEAWGNWKPSQKVLDSYPKTEPAQEESKTSSKKQDAEVAAQVEALVKKHKESGNKDIDELSPAVAKFLGTDGPTYEERMAELCFEDTWYGRKEVTCEK